MTAYSIFDGGPYVGTQTTPPENAGDPIQLGMAFALTEDLEGWTCTGARLFIRTENVADLEANFTMRAWLVNDFSGTPIAEKVGATGVGGWREVIWDDPFDMPDDQSKVYITYQFGTSQRFLTSGLGSSGSTLAAETPNLEIPSAASGRSYYRVASGSTTLNSDGPFYGVDIIVDDGTPPLEPIEFTCVRTTNTQAMLEWTDPGDAPDGVTILRAPGIHTTDGNGVPFGGFGYDPTTIVDSVLISSGEDSPFVDNGLEGTLNYTYAVIRTGSGA